MVSRGKKLSALFPGNYRGLPMLLDKTDSLLRKNQIWIGDPVFSGDAWIIERVAGKAL
jgi:hypothetical protein